MEDSEGSSSNIVNSYIAEFNEQFQKSRYKSGIDVSLTRCLNLMISVSNVDYYYPNSVPTTQFYINLHKLLSNPNIEDDLMWICISMLQHASKNLETRKAIISKFRFFPLIAKILAKLNTKEKAEKLMQFLQELSYGIVITWEEPYLSDLIKSLIDFINSEDDDLAQHSLLVLTNICHRNFPVMFVLMRMVNISELCKKTKKHGVLANKLVLILDQNNSQMDKDDVECLIKKCFIDFEPAIKKYDTPLLQHIVHFLKEIKENEQYKAAVVKFPDFQEELQKILQVIETNLTSENNEDDKEDESYKNRELCSSLALEFLSIILEISLAIKSKNGFSISNDILIKIFELCKIWCDNKVAGIKALLLLKSLFEMATDDLLAIILNKFEILPKIISATENNENSSQYATALQKLLLILLEKKNTQNVLFSLITDSYFNKILSPVLTERKNSQDFSVCSTADLSKYLHCFLILIKFSKIAQSTWKTKVDKFFQFHKMKYILARALLSDDSEMIQLMFEISETDSFPKDDVSKFVAELNKCSINRNPPQFSIINSTNIDAFFERNKLDLSKDVEHELNIILEKFSSSKLEIENVATSELIELYTYKTNMIETKVHHLEKNLDDANQRITNLIHEISFQNAELSKHTNINFQMHLTHEWLLNENKDLKKQRDIFKTTANDLGNTVKERTESLKRHMKTHEIKYAEKVNEINVMHKELSKMERERDDLAQKIKELTTQSEKFLKKIESLKKSIQLLEAKCAQNQINIEQKDKDIIKLNKSIDDLKKSQLMQENIIKSLENQVKEKNEIIKQCEAEINEVEDMRKTVMSLMESKKPKRIA